MIDFKLKITPAIPVEFRHEIEDLLKSKGYIIMRGGQFIDGSESDITFFKDGEDNATT